MFGKSIKLFTILGFTVKIDLSWLVILGLIIWSLAGGVFPAWYPGMAGWTYLLMAVAAAFGFFVSLVFHELCHSLVARRYGLPMEGITLFLLGGVAEMHDQPPSPKAEGLMAVAGPISSAVVAGVALGIAQLGTYYGWSQTILAVLGWVGTLNIALAIFNSLPGFPMDGGRVLRAILWSVRGDLRWATRIASYVGSGFGFLLMGLGAWQILAAGGLGGLWFILIGWFVYSASKAGYQQVLIRQALRGESIERFMNRDPVTAPPDVTVQELVENYIYEYHFKMFPVVEDGRLLGCVTTSRIKELDRDDWAETKVRDIAQECSDENTIGPDTEAVDAFMQMNRNKVSRVMVVRDGELVGILALKDLMKFLSFKLDLEGDVPGRGLPGKLGGPGPARIREGEPALDENAPQEPQEREGRSVSRT